jgi:hypothetical protein
MHGDIAREENAEESGFLDSCNEDGRKCNECHKNGYQTNPGHQELLSSNV